MTIEELEKQLAETTGKLEETTAKLEETTKHSREWESRAKANKAKADELEQLKADHETAVRELEELKTYKAKQDAAAEHAKLAQKVSDQTGVPADLIIGDDEQSMLDYATRLDQYAHPKPAGMPNQGSQPQNVDGQDMAARQAVNEMFDSI